jgi:solute:Na+ symporter, SSS family
MSTFIVGITLYFILMAWIGQRASRHIHTLEDYLVAGRKLPFYLAVPTIVATWFGAGSCMGVSGTVYSQGFYGVLADPFGCSFALIIAGLFFVVPFRRLKLLTISDLLRKAYGSNFETAATLLMVPFYIGTLASQMVAMGYVFHVTSGLSPEIGIIVGSIIVVTYTVAGGMWAVTLTDFVQLFFVVLGLGLIYSACRDVVPDHQAVLSLMADEFGTLVPGAKSGTDWLAYTGRIMMTGFGAIMGQDLLQRSFASRSEGVARASALTGALIYFLLGLIPLYIGLAGRSIFPNLSQPELLIPLLAKEFLTPLAFTIVACGLFSAIMSTADSYLLAGTSLLTHNVLLKIWPQDSEKSKIFCLRCINILISLAAFALAFSGQTIFDMMVHSGATLFVAIFVPTCFALFSKEVNAHGAWAALMGGTLSWLGYILFHANQLTSNNYEDVLFSAAAFGGAASLCAYVAIHLLNSTKKVAVTA